jgi:hypothetical protein
MRVLPFTAPIILAFGLSSTAVSAQAPTSGWRAEYLASLGTIETKFTALANATPWDKYGWRPSPDVKSVCEVFLHVAGHNYTIFANPLGAPTPANIDMKNIETCPASKEAVLATMKDSFANFRRAILATPDADADAKVVLNGKEITKRDVMLEAAEHAGEHLGQSIAYARMNGIVPPWSRTTP